MHLAICVSMHYILWENFKCRTAKNFCITEILLFVYVVKVAIYRLYESLTQDINYMYVCV